MSYMLAIEPHPAQADLLRHNVGAKTRTKLKVVESMDAALTAIDEKVPQLVLLSALLPPHEENKLVARLRSLPQPAAPEILIIPSLDEDSDASGQTLLDRFRKRNVESSGCRTTAFAEQLSAYVRKPKARQSSAKGGADGASRDADRRVALRCDRFDSAIAFVDGVPVDLVDVSTTGAQVVASMVLRPRETVRISLTRDERVVHCEGNVVWGGFEVAAEAGRPWYRAGIRFSDPDRRAIEALFFDPTRLASSREGTLVPQRSIVRTAADSRNRADRHRRGEMQCDSIVRLPWGLEVGLLNISSTGLLLESGSRLEAGLITNLTLRRAGHEVVIPARIVRSDVATVDSLGVRYHVAATFERELEWPELHPIEHRASLRCGTLSNLLIEVSALLGSAMPSTRRTELERVIGKLVAARTVHITAESVGVGADSRRLSFKIPGTHRTPLMLQATFDPDTEPNPNQRALLQAAANIVGVVLEFDETGAGATRPRLLLGAHRDDPISRPA
jgi:hypothetical protein